MKPTVFYATYCSGKPSAKTVQVLYGKLKEEFKPKPITKRYYFHSHSQRSAESLNEFYAALRNLSLDCDFKGFLDESLRDRFICGMRSDRIRQRLLTEKTLRLTDAVQTAITMEQAALENEVMKRDGKRTEKETNDVEEAHNLQTKTNRDGKKCYRCNSEFHLANKCEYKESVCRRKSIS